MFKTVSTYYQHMNVFIQVYAVRESNGAYEPHTNKQFIYTRYFNTENKCK